MIHLLGTVELSAAGRPLPISSRKGRTLLACLALDLERPQSVTSLADRLWDGEPPPSVVSTLHGYLSKLRSALRRANELAGGSDGRPIELVSRSGTYALHAQPEQVDWQLYHRLAVDARALAEAGEDRQALAVLDRAAQVWQGEPLAGLPGLWAQQVRSQLLDRRFATALTRFEVELRLGRYADLVPDLAELAEQQPCNEQVAAHLMAALYGCGRIAEALAAYRRIRRRMYEDLATGPGAALDRLHDGILRREQIADLIRRPPGTAPAPRTAPAAPPAPVPRGRPARRPSTLLPAPELFGREAELDLLTGAARGEWPAPAGSRTAALPVVALSGLPGSGKTALALTAAHRLLPDFPDGAFLLRLGAHSPTRPDTGPEAAATALLRQFGVPAPEIPLEPDELLARCRELLSQHRALVLLDDAAGPDQIGPLLPAAPTCFVVVTSRHRMAELAAVSTVPLDALTPDAAATMFTRLIGPDRATDPAHLAAVTRRCAHLPLALHLAAGRFRSHPSWDLAHLAGRLSRNSRLDELRHGPESLHAALAGSYQDLPADHQLALRRLSLHPGEEFGLLTAAVLVDCPVDRAEHLIEGLLAASLLSEHSVERFSFHELVREYAVTRQSIEESAQDRTATDRRVINFLTSTADWADRKIHPQRFRMDLPSLSPLLTTEDPVIGPAWPGRLSPKAWLATETETLTALERRLRAAGDSESAAVLAHLIAAELDSRCLWPEAGEAHRAAAAHWRAAGADLAEMHAQLALSGAELKLARYPESARAAKRALALAHAGGEQRGAAEALGRLGALRWHQGDLHGALALQRESRSVLRQVGDAAAAARATANLGLVQSQLGDTRAAIDSLSEALSFFRTADEQAVALQITNNIGGLYLEIGDTVAARRAFEAVSEAGEGTISPVDLAVSRVNLSRLMEIPREFDSAIRLIDSSVEVFRRSGSLRQQADAMNAKGLALFRSGNPESAMELFAEAHRIASAIGASREAVDALNGLARVEEVRPGIAVRARSGPAEISRGTAGGFAPEDALAHYREVLRAEAPPNPGPA
ncbi:AfsR/SARP family transcriptional regulator [Streptomyces sp. TLI_171]|uniref:AfsR/SARP family transcriptional regulator n=1 Tax=Streptomyces sp. TLI_171 TaxID=1938859 RepID=UPI000C1A7CB1|nr:AfsR/SARP family transcriptional regulator [Streptomyces sp. TLI_171]RKE18511.1 DNA-binding SARP family transcriptional activator [Streptomyces sp. TLI_171]